MITNLLRKNGAKILTIGLISLLSFPEAKAQRIQQRLGRGVVAVYGSSNGSAGVEITWRRLAQEPEDAKYNIYVASSENGSYSLVNPSPLSNTNYATTLSKVPYGSYVAVTIIADGKESERSKPFLFKNTGLRNIYMEIGFSKSPLDKTKYTTKFVWPCDLNGDGEMDYVVDRCPVDGSRNYHIEGYLADGTFLWDVDLGPNEVPCDGQNDNMCAYDIDCDGYGELIVQTSDGTRFWDKATGTWGKYLFGKTTGDSDGDGIIDYESQATKNPPRYLTVIDGMTGAEKSSAEFTYDVAYNRTNKAALMGEEYNKHEGHVGIFYNDGVHPAIVGEWHTRSADGNTHYYRNAVFAYDFSQGKASNWHQLSNYAPGGAVFHQIRIADVDGDGCDEMLSGAYAMNNDGTTLYNSGIAHGDRHRTSDIDPERPGLETFSIQQYAGDMLGQILFDAGTGEPIKKWYLSAVGDVGRAECMDVDKSHIGWEMWSTMDGVYDAKGNRIEGLTNVYPTEGMWWDGNLDREILQTSDSHYNFYFQDYGGGRLIEPAKESGYTLKTSYGKRGKFWGDIIGDWREELVVIREIGGVCEGIVGLTSDYKTSIDNIYCLQEDPHYRLDCTTRGYYQTPNPGFYLGYDMPRPQLPPVMVADDENDVFGITLGNATISPRNGMKNIYVMPVKGQTLTIASVLSGNTNLWKSQQGTLIVNGNNTSTGKTIISEGTLQLNGEISGTLDIRARGTLSGSGTVNDVILEGALNYEGGRIMPTSVITFNKGLNINKKTYIELDLDNETKVNVNGDLTITKEVIFTINAKAPEAGEYKLVEYTGLFSGNIANASVRGLTGLSYSIANKDNAIVLVINHQREASTGVKWTGTTNGTWDYQTENFTLNGTNTCFVAGDDVVFSDEASTTTISLNDLMPVGSATFANATKTYTLNGDAGISGEGNLVMNGAGKLVINTTNANYKGKTILNAGTVTVKELADGGIPSSLGAASSDAANFQFGKTTLVVNNSNTATDHGITLTDTATVQVNSGTTSFKGIIKGNGTLRKTGTGQLNITYGGSNTWTGGTVLVAGTLAQGSYNSTFGSSTSTIHVVGNATISQFYTTSTGNAPTFSNTVNIDKGKTLTFNASGRGSIRGSLIGEGTYKISFPYVRGDVYTNTSNFQGTYDVLTSNCRFVQGMDMSKATLKLENESYAAGYKAGNSSEQSYTNKIGAIAGSGTLGSGTWQIGFLGLDDTFAGVFNASAPVTKVGAGSLTLTGASAAAITINEGAVYANNTSAATTSGTITVKASGMLGGTGQVQTVSVQKDGTIGGGKAGVLVGALTVNGNLTVASGGKIRVRYRSTATKTTCDAIKAVGNVKLTSPVIEISSLNDTEILDNSELPIFTGNGTISITGDVTIIPAQPKVGWVWDTSSLASEGVLRIVADPTAIREINMESISDSNVIYDLSGRRANTIKAGEAYIINGKKVKVKN